MLWVQRKKKRGHSVSGEEAPAIFAILQRWLIPQFAQHIEKLLAAMNVQFGVNMLSVSTHSILADNKPLGDGRHGVAAGDELHHLCLAHGKTVAFLQYQALLGKPVANGTGVLRSRRPTSTTFGWRGRFIVGGRSYAGIAILQRLR